MAAEQEGRYPIRAVDRVCDLLDALRAGDESFTLTALAQRVALPKSSTLRYLSALESRHYVTRDPADGSYRLGIAFRPDNRHWLEQAQYVALPHLVRLRDEFGETVNLGVLEGTSMLHIEVVESLHPVRLAGRRGDRAPMHATAIGKAAASTMPEDRIREVLASTGLPRLTEHTLDSVEDFLRAAARCAASGHAIDDREHQPDGRCVAVPLAGLPLPAAVSVSAPASRFSRRQATASARQLADSVRPLQQQLTGLL